MTPVLASDKRVERLLENAQSDRAQSVFFVDELALLGDPQTTASRSVRSAAHQHLCASAAAIGAAALAMKQGEIDARGIRCGE